MTNIRDSYSLDPLWGKVVSSFDIGIFEYFEFRQENEIFYFQYIKRDISNELSFLEENKYFDIITPFDYGGFYYTSEEILEKALKEFDKKCIKENIISGFFRFNPLLKQNYNLIAKYIAIIQLQDHIVINLENDYKSHYSANKRRDITKQRKYDYELIENDSIDNFYKVYIESMNRINTNEYFLFDKQILSNLLNNGKIFSIKFDNTIVNSVFIIEDRFNIYYFLSGGLTDYLKYGFNSLLLDLVADYYSQAKTKFLLGGGKDGLYKFKKRFSNNTTSFHIGKKIFNKEVYDKITEKANKKDNNFFPKYRNKII